MLRHRVEMNASIIFDTVMPEGATDQEIKAQAALDYRNAIKTWPEKFILYCGLPDCRVYVCAPDEAEPADILIADTEIIFEDEED